MGNSITRHTAVFDALAGTYDSTFSDTELGRLLREMVWQKTKPLLDSNTKILDIGCGTGIDAVWFGALGCEVCAVDSSPVMIASARRRVLDHGLADRISLSCCDAGEPDQLPKDRFHLIFSNFGALNCIKHLDQTLLFLARTQKPGDHAILVLMGRLCLWEICWFTFKGQFNRVLRRFGDTRFDLNGLSMKVYYPLIRQLQAGLRSEYQLNECHGLGFLLPPSYLSHLVAKWPRCSNYLARLERRISSYWPFTAISDHKILIFERIELHS